MKVKNEDVKSRWTLIKITGRVDKNRHAFGLYRCDCGTVKEVNVDSVKRGLSKSCGCHRSKLPNPNYKHGLSKHKLMGVWNGMIQRCNNPNNKRYNRYGGRGIKVCDRWRSFKNFYADVIIDYEPGLQIDRIDNDGDYEPDNTRWVSQTINIRNSYCTPLTRAKVTAIRKSTFSVRLLAERFHVTETTIYNIKRNKTWNDNF